MKGDEDEDCDDSDPILIEEELHLDDDPEDRPFLGIDDPEDRPFLGVDLTEVDASKPNPYKPNPYNTSQLGPELLLLWTLWHSRMPLAAKGIYDVSPVADAAYCAFWRSHGLLALEAHELFSQLVSRWLSSVAARGSSGGPWVSEAQEQLRVLLVTARAVTHALQLSRMWQETGNYVHYGELRIHPSVRAFNALRDRAHQQTPAYRTWRKKYEAERWADVKANPEKLSAKKLRDADTKRRLRADPEYRRAEAEKRRLARKTNKERRKLISSV